MSNRTELLKGILVGMGVILIILGLFGWFTAHYLSGTLSSILSDLGIDVSRHYIFTELSELKLVNMSFIAIGIVALIYSKFMKPK